MKHTTETIWNMFCCKLKPFIFKWVSDPYIADEIVQEVFIKIHEKIDSLKDNTKVHSWVLQITKNTIFDYFRNQKMKFDSLDKIEAEENFIIDSIKVENERDFQEEVSSGLRSMIESLPEKYYQALVLVEYEGLSQIDLAKKLNISPSGAKSRVQRARKMVQNILMNCCHYEFDKYGTVIGVKPKECCCCNDQQDC